MKHKHFILRICIETAHVDIFNYFNYEFWIIAGAGFASNQLFLFGQIDMQIKLVPGDSAGTVLAFYVRTIFILFSIYVYLICESLATN